MIVGQMVVGQMSVRQMIVGQLIVGQMIVGQMIVGQMIVGQMIWRTNVFNNKCIDLILFFIKDNQHSRYLSLLAKLLMIWSFFHKRETIQSVKLTN